VSSPLLSIAAGALQGAVDTREKNKRDAEADLARRLQLMNTPGVSLEPTGVRSALDVAAAIANGDATGGIGGAPGGGTAPGKKAGSVTLNGRPMDVQYDDTQSPTAIAKAERARSSVQWQTVTNPRTKQPFTAQEADLLASGKAKYGDFKPEPAAPHIDPLSPEGITASGKKAGAEASARAPYAAPPTQIVTDDQGNVVVVNKRDASTASTGVKARAEECQGGAGGQAARSAAAAIPELDRGRGDHRQVRRPDDAHAMSKKAGLLGNYMNTPEGPAAESSDHAVRHAVRAREGEQATDRRDDASVLRDLRALAGRRRRRCARRSGRAPDAHRKRDGGIGQGHDAAASADPGGDVDLGASATSAKARGVAPDAVIDAGARQVRR
jgi:hypothetical protein